MQICCPVIFTQQIKTFDSNNFTVFNVLFPKKMSLKRKAVSTAVQSKNNAHKKIGARTSCAATSESDVFLRTDCGLAVRTLK